ncbi:uncharacterized protein LOC123266152 [Cotesia glomerata]|uniref:uncharacterized protein LOC123266152 n=1 Tax=Cotesia glomerata TaxID=32391 RepID=UPI001D0029EF|nr:uncharacterized protein LOC123266152 [Cotesia glomerata]
MSSTNCEDIKDLEKKNKCIRNKLTWCEELTETEKRHQCFRKKCFREVYDYNARAIIKTRLPFSFPVINYYAIRRRSKGTEAYEAILKSYYRWVMFSELAFDLYGYLTLFDSGNYVCADACEKEVKFGYYTDVDDENFLYLVATLESGNLQAWIIDTDDNVIPINTKPIENSKAKYKNLCYGTARNFYLSNKLVINKLIIEHEKMEFTSSFELPKEEDDSKKSSEGMIKYSDEIIALDSNDMNIYAVTCRVDKNADSKIEQLFLERYVCEDFLLICTEGGITCDRKFYYEPLPTEFDSTTKVYLTMEDFIICTCGKYIAVYDEPLNEWIVVELINDDQYVTTLIVHVNLLLVGFNTGDIYGYDVSRTQSLMKPNFLNGPKFKIIGTIDPIIAFKVFERQFDKYDFETNNFPKDEKKYDFYPYILVMTTKNAYLFRYTNTRRLTDNDHYFSLYRRSSETLPKITRCDIHKDDQYTYVDK